MMWEFKKRMWAKFEKAFEKVDEAFAEADSDSAFGGFEACPKCGHCNISIKYCNDETHSSHIVWTNMCAGHYQHEVLHIRCNVCSYEWITPTKDK
jgi:hypothetical protein